MQFQYLQRFHSLDYLPFLDRLVCVALSDAKAIKKPPESTFINLEMCSTYVLRPLKSILFEPLVVQPKSGMVPFEDLDFITFSIAKYKQASRKRIKLKTLLDYKGQSID